MHLVLDAVLDARPVALLDAIIAREHVHGHAARAGDQLLVFAHIHKAAGDQLRAGGHLARLLAHADDHDDQAVLGQVLAVAQHDVAHVAHAQAVDHDRAGLNRAGDVRLVLRELQHLAQLQDDRIVCGHAHLHRDFGMALQHSVLAVHRNEVLRPHQRLHELELLLAGMAGDVHIRDAVVNHVRADAVELVDDA